VDEGPSIARDIARVLGASKRRVGYLGGDGYAVTWVRWQEEREPLPIVLSTWNCLHMDMRLAGFVGFLVFLLRGKVQPVRRRRECFSIIE